ncbi:MAG: tetratricopeptide repeat protein, partial [Bacteroidota bacterium]
MKLKYIFLMAVWAVSGWNAIYAQSSDDLARKVTKDEIQDLLDIARDGRFAPMDSLLESVVDHSERIGYAEGTRTAFELLIQHHLRKKDHTSELRARLRLVNHLDNMRLREDAAQERFYTGNFYLLHQVYPKAEEAFRQVIDSIGDQNPDLTYQSRQQYAWTLRKSGKIDLAEKQYRKFLKSARAKNDYDDVFLSLQALARMAHNLNHFAEEANYYKQIEVEARSRSRHQDQLVALNNVGYAYNYLKLPDSSETYFKRVLSSLRNNEAPQLRSDVLTNLGIIYHNRERYNLALKHLQDAARLAKRHGEHEQQAKALEYISRVYLHKGEAFSALDKNQEAIDLARTHAHYKLLQESYATRSEIYQSLFEFENALDSYKSFLNYRDTVNNALQERQALIMQEQYVMERLEKELRLVWADRVLDQVQIARLEAVNKQTEAEKAQERETRLRLEKEADLKDAELANSDLERRRVQAALALTRKEGELKDKETAIELLNKEKSIQTLELDRQRLENKNKENELKAAAEAKKLAEAEQRAATASLRNLIYVLIGLGLLVLVILYA